MGPLTDSLQKDLFHWTKLTQEAFESLKKKLSSTLVLNLPNFTQEIQVETDASRQGIGAVLSQRRHPIAYFSQKLSRRIQ